MRALRRPMAVLSALSLAAISAVAVGAASSPATGATAPSASAPVVDPLPIISLRAAANRVVAETFDGDVYLNLGIYAVAGDEAFEVRASRTPNYRTPITAHLVTTAGDVPLPAQMSTFEGLPRFVHLRIKDTAGKIVLNRLQKFCPVGEAVRVRPDAPDVSTYPSDCPYNAFTLGGVYGIDPGFGLPVVDPYARPAKLKPGRYTASVWIDEAYRAAIGVDAADVAKKITLRVVKGDDGCLIDRGCMRPDRQDRQQQRLAAMHGSDVPSHPSRSEPTGPALVDPPSGSTPDLRSLPAYDITLGPKGSYLQFAATVWNAGPSPLVVDGFRRPTEDVMDAYQYFYDADGNSQGYAPAGAMEWDARHGHNHWHFRDFARYRLLDHDKNNVVRSRKEAFCLANTDAINYTVPGANWHPDNTDLHTSCGDYSALSVREVLEAGSGDTYYQSVAGQSFNISDLPNGVYFIAVEANPKGTLIESNTTNNNSYRRIIIGGTPKHRVVRVPAVGLVDVS